MECQLQNSQNDGDSFAIVWENLSAAYSNDSESSGGQLSEQALEDNYRSILKVVDVYEPERSLVLRKPLSPSGQGE